MERNKETNKVKTDLFTIWLNKAKFNFFLNYQLFPDKISQ